MTLADLNWLAGFLEGEGWFGTHPYHNGKRLPAFQASNVDRDVLERVARLVQRSAYSSHPPSRGHHQTQWIVRVVGRDAIGWMFTLYPLLGLRRQQRIREVIAEWKLTPYKRRRKGWL